MASSPLRFGTRGSKLARWQTEHVLLMLSLGGELKVIETKGDRVLDTPLPLIEPSVHVLAHHFGVLEHDALLPLFPQ